MVVAEGLNADMKFVKTESIYLILFGCGIMWHQTWASGRQMLFEIRNICSTMTYGNITRIHGNVANMMTCLALCRNNTECMSCTYDQVNLQCTENTMITTNYTTCERNLKYSANPQCEQSGAFRICGTDLYPVPGEIRGYVVATVNGVTGTVCDDRWHYAYDQGQNANVLCKSFGYSNGSAIDFADRKTPSGYTGPIVMDDVKCLGTESSLLECYFITNHNCRHEEDVQVQCKK